MEIFCGDNGASLAGRGRVDIACYMLMCFCMVGCSSGQSDVAFDTPLPPSVPREDISTVDVSVVPETDLTLSVSARDALAEGDHAAQASLQAEEVAKACSLRHRFDRKALIAYEWGDNRLGLDMDGVNMAGADIKAAMVTYRFRFSPDRKVAYKTKREKCRYHSKWQGLIGSGYNEFFVREDDTVVQGVSSFIKDGVSQSF